MKDVTIFDGIDADSIENFKKKSLVSNEGILIQLIHGDGKD